VFPLDGREVTDLTFYINLFNFWGGFGFLFSGAFGFYMEKELWLYRLEIAIGYVAGSALFFCASFLMFVELSNPLR